MTAKDRGFSEKIVSMAIPGDVVLIRRIAARRALDQQSGAARACSLCRSC